MRRGANPKGSAKQVASTLLPQPTMSTRNALSTFRLDAELKQFLNDEAVRLSNEGIAKVTMSDIINAAVRQYRNSVTTTTTKTTKKVKTTK